MLFNGDTGLAIKTEGPTEGRSTGGEVEGWQSVLRISQRAAMSRPCSLTLGKSSGRRDRRVAE